MCHVRKESHFHMNLTINTAQRQYVLNTGSGVSCLGFDVALGMVTKLSEVMGCPMPQAELGSEDLYQAYEDLIQRFKSHPASQKTWFQPGTDKAVERMLERARKEDRVLRLFYGSPKTGYDWCEENDVVGFVGRSTGVTKCPLLMRAYRGSYFARLESDNYGTAIGCPSIVRIIDVLTEEELYRCPQYQMPVFSIQPAIDLYKKAGLHFSVLREDSTTMPGINVANFHTQYRAEEYIAFMRGIKVAMPFLTREEVQRDSMLS